MKLDKSQDMWWTWLQWPQDWSVNMQILRDSNRKQRSLDSKIQALTVKENDVKTPHASAHK
jgi:hypothetical protein